MPPKKQEYGSKYLYSEDLLAGGEYRTVQVEISEVIPPFTLTAANGKVVDKYTLRFAGKEKMLVLCKTNASMVCFATGEQIESAVGKSITLQPRIVEAFGDQVVAIRVMPPPGVKVRKNVLARLGTKAFWKQEPEQAEPAAV